MDDEISQEAKASLADSHRRRAIERLRMAGAESIPAIQRRIQALAAERSIPPADYAKLMYKRVSTSAVVDFCTKHSVSFDWLLSGDLKGLQRMKRWRPPPQPSAKDLEQKILSLPPEARQIIEATIDRLLEQRE